MIKLYTLPYPRFVFLLLFLHSSSLQVKKKIISRNDVPPVFPLLRPTYFFSKTMLPSLPTARSRTLFHPRRVECLCCRYFSNSLPIIFHCFRLVKYCDFCDNETIWDSFQEILYFNPSTFLSFHFSVCLMRHAERQSLNSMKQCTYVFLKC